MFFLQEHLRLQQPETTEPTQDEVARHLKLRSAATVQQRLDNAAQAKVLLQQYNVRLVISVARQFKDRCPPPFHTLYGWQCALMKTLVARSFVS